MISRQTRVRMECTNTEALTLTSRSGYPGLVTASRALISVNAAGTLTGSSLPSIDVNGRGDVAIVAAAGLLLLFGGRYKAIVHRLLMVVPAIKVVP